MSHTLSATAKAAVFAQETSEVILAILTIDHSSMATPIRVVNDYNNIVSQGETYLGFPFDITFPDDSESQLPSAKLTIDNVDRQIVEAIRTLTGPATMSLSLILQSTPDTIERGPYELQMRNVEYDAMTVSADLLNDDIFNEPYPGHAYTPANFPGLFP
jgi:hypothetical protein